MVSGAWIGVMSLRVGVAPARSPATRRSSGTAAAFAGFFPYAGQSYPSAKSSETCVAVSKEGHSLVV